MGYHRGWFLTVHGAITEDGTRMTNVIRDGHSWTWPEGEDLDVIVNSA